MSEALLDLMERYEDRVVAAALTNPAGLTREQRADALDVAIVRLQMFVRDLRSPPGNGTPF